MSCYWGCTQQEARNCASLPDQDEVIKRSLQGFFLLKAAFVCELPPGLSLQARHRDAFDDLILENYKEQQGQDGSQQIHCHDGVD
jgi:hypothetical protein